MRKTYATALAGIALAAAVAVPTAASAAPASTAGQNGRHCAAGMHATVVEDNEAYAAKDAARYAAVLNPDMITDADGVTTYGRPAVMEQALANFAVPGWRWVWTIESETLFSCYAGVAILDAHVIRADGVDRHFSATMTMVRERGRWTVGMDTVHLISQTSPA